MPRLPALSRRAALATLGALGLARPALAQGAFPERPIRLIVPWTAGGSADAQFRVLAEQAGRHFGQPVVIENRPGATGTMGAIALKDARPDGYLVSQIHMSVFRRSLMMANPTYDPLTDFTYILQITGNLLGIVVRAEAPWRSFEELTEHARRNPGKLTYGTLGIGSSQHISMEQVTARTGVDWTHVPYRGTSETLTALMAGQIDLAADSSAWAPMVREGRMRLLVIFGPQRTPGFPDVPTLREMGVDYDNQAAYGLGGPRNLPQPILQALHDGFHWAMQQPAHLAMLERLDQPLLYLNSADYAAAARRYMAEERAILEKIGMYRKS